MKSVTLVQRAYRSEYKNNKCPTKATILKLSRKLDRTGYLIFLHNPRMSERHVLRPELHWTFCSPKIRHYQSERHQLMSVFHILFAVIYFLTTYASSRTNIKVLTSYCHSITKKGYFCSMAARLGKEHLQVVNRFWWGILLFDRINQQTKQ